MQIPLGIYNTWKAVAEKFQGLHEGTDDDRREATKRGVSTIRARHGIEGMRWVCKTQHSTGWPSQSKDAIAWVEEGPIVTGRLARMEMFDMINGTTRKTNPYPVESKNHEEGNHEAYILAPPEFDWLGVNPDPPPVDPPPVDPPPPNEDLAALKLAVARLTVRVEALEEELRLVRVIAVKANTRQFRAVGAPDGDAVDTSRTALHSHQIRLRIEEVR